MTSNINASLEETLSYIAGQLKTLTSIASPTGYTRAATDYLMEKMCIRDRSNAIRMFIAAFNRCGTFPFDISPNGAFGKDCPQQLVVKERPQ